MNEETVKAIDAIMEILKINYPNYISFGNEGIHQINDDLQNYTDDALQIILEEQLIEMQKIPKYEAQDFKEGLQILLPVGDKKIDGYKITKEGNRFFISWEKYNLNVKEERLMPKQLRAKQFALLTKQLQDWQYTKAGVWFTIIGATAGIISLLIKLLIG